MKGRTAAGAGALALILALAASRWRTTSQVEGWCNAIPPGTARADVIASAVDARLDLPADTSGNGLGVHLRLLPVGYAICTVSFDRDKVVGTRYETS